jgi:multidrug transporter EmrE-like cation transporter
MALRKLGGEGVEKYYLEWKWWVGTIVDGVAGVMIWPAMPYVSVQIFAPLIIVCQLGTSYILGLVVFKEKCRLMHNVGLSCAIAGVIGVSLSTSHQAANFSIAEFWAGWVTPRFLMTSLVALIVLTVCFFTTHRSTFWALAAAACEGIQYICSRSIVDSIFDYELDFFLQPAVFAAFLVKSLCILGILHFQQLGLSADLSRFAGIYLVGCTVFMCVYGAAFFGDPLPLNFGFAISAFFTLAGIWLLNQKHADSDIEGPSKDALAKDVETSDAGKQPQKA